MPAICTLRVDNSIKNSTMYRCSPRRVHTSTVKKSAATSRSQCWLRNSFHLVFRLRSGAGSIPCRSRISAIVLRARSCPRLDQPLRPKGWGGASGGGLHHRHARDVVGLQLVSTRQTRSARTIRGVGRPSALIAEGRKLRSTDDPLYNQRLCRTCAVSDGRL